MCLLSADALCMGVLRVVYDSVFKVSWRISECDTLHQDAQLVQNTSTDRQPVEHLQCSCGHKSLSGIDVEYAAKPVKLTAVKEAH